MIEIDVAMAKGIRRCLCKARIELGDDEFYQWWQELDRLIKEAGRKAEMEDTLAGIAAAENAGGEARDEYGSLT